MNEVMTLEYVRDLLREYDPRGDEYNGKYFLPMCADAIDAHLSRKVSVSDADFKLSEDAYLREGLWQSCNERVRRALRAALESFAASLPVARVREGWKWVPVEPTREMSDAGKHAVKGCDSTYERQIAGIAYAAMLNACPSTDGAPSGWEGEV